MEPLTRFRSPRSRDQPFSLYPRNIYPNFARISVFFCFVFLLSKNEDYEEEHKDRFFILSSVRRNFSLFSINYCEDDDEKNRCVSIYDFLYFTVNFFFDEDYRNERRIDLFLIGKNIPLLIMRRRIDLCFNVDILRLSFCKFSIRIFLFSKDYEERLWRRIDLCLNFHCKFHKNILFFLLLFLRRLREWWEESIFFPSMGILSGKDYEDQEENRSFQLRYFASFTVNFFYRKIFFLLKIIRTIKNWSLLQFRYSVSFASFTFKFRENFFFRRKWREDRFSLIDETIPF